MNICLFTEDEIQKPLSLHDERAEHLIKVLHKKSGDSFFAGVVGGKTGTATITHIGTKKDADGCFLDFVFLPDGDGLPDRSKPLLPITLIVGFPRPIQLRRLLRDVAGLGCESVHLTGTELGDKNYMKSTLVERGAAERMLLDGTVQAGSTHVPRLQMHKSLSECLEEICPAPNVQPGKKHMLIALDNVKPAASLPEFLRMKNSCQNHEDYKSHVVLAIGSERGWTDRERDLLCAKGFVLCGLGKRILRTETAATAAVAIAAAESFM